MTYIDEEKAGADPVELYKFQIGDTVYRYTDSDADYTHPTTADVYTAEPISRGNLTQSEEDGSMSVDVSVDSRNDVAGFFRTAFLPTKHVWLTIYRTHRDSVIEPATIFFGAVGQVEFTGSTAKMSCVPAQSAIAKKIPIQLVQRLCTNTLYDQRCKLVPDDFSITGTILSISGLVFTMDYGGSTGSAIGYYNTGYIEKDGVPLATIKRDDAPELEVFYNPGYVVGDLINIRAGCDKKQSTCRAKFANEAHFQGFPFIPIKDPFAGEVM